MITASKGGSGEDLPSDLRDGDLSEHEEDDAGEGPLVARRYGVPDRSARRDRRAGRRCIEAMLKWAAERETARMKTARVWSIAYRPRRQHGQAGMDGREFRSRSCSTMSSSSRSLFPSDLEALAVGFLFSEGMIRSKDEVTGLALDDERGIIRIRTAEDKTPDGKLFMKRVLTTGCGRGMAFYSYATWTGRRRSSPT